MMIKYVVQNQFLKNTQLHMVTLAVKIAYFLASLYLHSRVNQWCVKFYFFDNLMGLAVNWVYDGIKYARPPLFHYSYGSSRW